VRLVMETDRFTVLEPYAPRFPFETWILPKLHQSHFEDSDAPRSEPGLGFALDHAQNRQGAGAPAYNFIVHSAPVQDVRLPLPLAPGRSCPS